MRFRAFIFRILMLAYLAGVAYLCFHNFSKLPEIDRSMFGFETDKVVHFFMFLPFPVLAIWWYVKLPDTFWKCLFRRLDVLVVGCAIAGITEMIQTKLVYRCGDFRDLKADLIALAAGSLIALVLETVSLIRKRHA